MCMFLSLGRGVGRMGGRGAEGDVRRELVEMRRRVRELEGIEEKLQVSRDEVCRVEVLLNEARVQREQAVEREKRFIEEISHYFFNPLCVAKGYLLLLERNVARDEQKKDIEGVKRAVERIENMVIDVVGRESGQGMNGGRLYG